MQVQCAVFERGAARCIVDLGDRIDIRPVPFDADFAGEILDEVAKFYRDFVVTQRPPEVDGSDSYSEWIERRFPGADARSDG
jgi:hypothetical protein